MKKYIVFLITVLVLSTFPAQAQSNYIPSYYAATTNLNIGLIVPYKDVALFDSTMFDTATIGVYILDGDTFIANNYAGITKVTGSCYQYFAENPIDILLFTDAGPFLVASGIGKFFHFEFVTASPWLQIGARQDIQGYTN